MAERFATITASGMIKTPEDYEAPHAAIIETTLTEHNYALWAVGDKCLVEEDVFKSGNECPVCHNDREHLIYKDVGVGAYKQSVAFTTIDCEDCEGRGKRKSIVASESNGPLVECKSCGCSGRKVCPNCKGTGQKTQIANPDNQRKEKVTTGIIRSLGPKFGKFVTLNGEILTHESYKVGERVAFGNYSGTQVTFGQTANMLVLREHELLFKVALVPKEVTTDKPASIPTDLISVTEGR